MSVPVPGSLLLLRRRLVVGTGELLPDEVVHIEAGVIGCRIHSLVILDRILLIRVGLQIVVVVFFFIFYSRR